MVRGYWYAVAESGAIGRKPVALRRFGRDYVAWREGGRLNMLPDRCSHRGAPLSGGKLLKNGCLECPYHGFQFDNDGKCVAIPANGRAKPISPAFDLSPEHVREDEGLIWMWWGSRKPDKALPWFKETPDRSIPSHTITLEWSVSFRRAMESMLDMHHFPYLHRKVSGDLGALIDPYVVEVTGDRIDTHGNLRPDDGKEVADSPGFAFQMSVLFPSMMFMGLTEKLRLLVLCCPIDENHTWLAFRYFQEYLKTPVLGGLIARVSAAIERKWVHPDDEMILRQLRDPEPGQNENRFILADKGIAAWLKRYRAELEPRESEIKLSFAAAGD